MTLESGTALEGAGAVEVLEMVDIGKSFSGVRALDGVSLSLREGGVHAILGENGAGKSTLMNVLAGAFVDYDGSILVDGAPAAIHAPRDAQQRGIAMIHQELNLVPGMSISDNVFLGRELHSALGGLDRRTMRRRTRELLESLGLRLDPAMAVGSCKLAEQQLIEVAKALSLNVRVLVMDEPTSALADAEVRRLFGVIRDLTARGVAVVYISHRLEELEEIADEVTVLRDGRLVGTRPMSGVDRGELIRMMVGRPLGELFPRTADTVAADVPALEVSGLGLRPDPRGGYTALHDIDIAVRPGEIVGVAGLMGAGRSELLESVFGVRAPRRTGTMSVGGRPYRPRSPAAALGRGVALVAEDRKTQSLVLDNTVRFNTTLASLASYRGLFGVDKGRERTAARRMVDTLQIKTAGIERPVATLSGGNQQKVVLAKCLLTEPTVLLLDEPTRGVDVGAKAEIYELMSRLTEQGAAILMASSELPELLAMCDRIVVLCEGRVTGEFTRENATQEAILEAAMARRTVLDLPDEASSATSGPPR